MVIQFSCPIFYVGKTGNFDERNTGRENWIRFLDKFLDKFLDLFFGSDFRPLKNWTTFLDGIFGCHFRARWKKLDVGFPPQKIGRKNWIGLSSPNFLDDKIELASVVQSKGRMFHTQ